MAKYTFRVIVERDEDGLFVASVPALPGCYTQGKTYEQTVERVKEAILLNLEAQGRRLTSPDQLYQPSFVGLEELTVSYA